MKHIFSLLLCVMVLQFAFSQTTYDDQLEQETILPMVILTNPKYFGKEQYETLDGEPLPYKKVSELVSTIPQNASLLKEEKGWYIAGLTALGLFIASSVIMYVYDRDLPYQSIMFPVGYYTASSSFLGMLICGQVRQKKTQRIIDNYNISVMGVTLKP